VLGFHKVSGQRSDLVIAKFCFASNLAGFRRDRCLRSLGLVGGGAGVSLSLCGCLCGCVRQEPAGQPPGEPAGARAAA
jgi:hypothetical protein